MLQDKNSLHNLVHSLALEGFKKAEKKSYDDNEILSKIRGLGSLLWVDTGDLEKAKGLWNAEFSALTTNNTLANQVVQTGVMDGEIKNSISKIKEKFPDIDDKTLVYEIGFIINCKIALRLVSEFDAKVSVELHPAFSRDKALSISYAKRYFDVCKENFIIKIPLTPEGYLAVSELADGGMPINFTLGFSARQNYFAARVSNPAYCNVFLGRLNAVVIDNNLGDGKNVGEKVTKATNFNLNELKKSVASVNTKLIAASIRSSDQVKDLAGIDVLTIPPAALEGFLSGEMNSSDLKSYKENEFSVTIEGSNKNSFEKLWTVDDNFKAFTEKIVSNVNSMTGNDLRSICMENGIDLFYDFKETDFLKIKNDGKIPKLSEWDEKIAIDDLMTVSALMSFTKDQESLDSRISGFIG